jgi:hypothetical protein
MNIGIAVTLAAFGSSRAQTTARKLLAQLIAAGHDAQLYRLPARLDSVDSVRDSVIAAALVQVEGPDRLIALDFPAYHARHPHKTIWLVDAWNDASLLGDATADGRRVLATIAAANRRCRADCARFFVDSSAGVELGSHATGQILDAPALPPSRQDDWQPIVEALVS